MGYYTVSVLSSTGRAANRCRRLRWAPGYATVLALQLLDAGAAGPTLPSCLGLMLRATGRAASVIGRNANIFLFLSGGLSFALAGLPGVSCACLARVLILRLCSPLSSSIDPRSGSSAALAEFAASAPLLKLHRAPAARSSESSRACGPAAGRPSSLFARTAVPPIIHIH